MRDKDIVALLTIIFFILYFIPNWIFKLISVLFILFFAPGFFTLRIYKKIKREELILIAPPLSLGISGVAALLLAYFSILNSFNMLLIIGVYIVITYLLSSYENIEGIKLSKPSKFVIILIILSVLLILIWGTMEVIHPPYKELDISIEKWPHNATVGENLSFEIYIKNWDYKDANCKVVFKLNNHTISERKVILLKGEGVYLNFYANATKKGLNIASFDLFLNKAFYSNVHVYFMVESSK